MNNRPNQENLRFVNWIFPISLLLLASTFSPAQAQNTQTTTLYGKVEYRGAIPSVERELIKKDIEVCGETRALTPLLVNEHNELKDVIVSIAGMSELPAPPVAPAIIRNEKCRFLNRISTASVRQPLEVQNLDAILHNTHIRTKSRAFFNVVLLPESKGIKKVLKKPGPMTIVCNKHPFMKGHIHVFDHPYHTVTNAKGTFTISNIPPGTHILSLWHETLGAMQQTITLPQKDGTVLTLEFPAP